MGTNALCNVGAASACGGFGLLVPSDRGLIGSSKPLRSTAFGCSILSGI